MNLQELQVTFQAISSFAIAGGLIWSAYQFQSYRKAQTFANFTKLVESQMHLREMRVSSPELADVYLDDVKHAMETANPRKSVQEYFLNLMQLSVFEIVWYGYKHGQIPEDYFRSWETRMREVVIEKSFREMWATPSMKIMHDEFQKYMEQLVRTTPVMER